MALESSRICARNSRILSGSGSLLTRSRRRQPLPFFNEENKVGLRSHQSLGGGRAIEIGRDQLLDCARLQADLATEPGDIAIEQNQTAVHRSPQAKVMIRDA
jgi:hypothetical protein